MGFWKEKRDSKEKERRPDQGDSRAEGPEYQRCVCGNFCLGKGSKTRKRWIGRVVLTSKAEPSELEMSELTMR